ncbi:Tetratricopeptide-like helical [Penicillium cf. griseofulvum]|nr:Tetratricopeptide-like helical [Penicillium cf. griseofulvum]
MSRPLKHRDIACARCFRHKRKCDHAKPSCGECRRKGAECLPARSRKSGDNITIPLDYLRQLERRVAELDCGSSVTETTVEICDAGVQTDFGDPEHRRNDPRNDSDYLMADQNASGAENDSSLILLPDLQHSSQRSPRVSPPSFLPDAFSLFPETTFDVPWIGLAPSYPLTDDDSPWLKELYTNVYFSVTHREWPFLNEAAWKSWHAEAILDGEDEWKAFFLQMVYAIGASLCSNLQRDPSHSVRSKEYYASAMRYYPYVVGHSSMVLQIQASLFMILYAMHSPSSEDITTSVSSVLPFCTATTIEIQKHVSICCDNGSMTEPIEVLPENMFITCYMLNEIIVSGWDRPVSAAYRAVDDDMCTLGDTLQPTLSTNPAIRHLFRLRKIQASIRRSRENRPRNPLVRDGKGYTSSFKSALDRWRQEIPHYESDNDQHGYLHPIWMRKLYVYSLLILMEEKRDFIEMDGAEEILVTIAEACLNFRLLQEEGHVMCFTWSALVFQFRAGIMMLYIVWVTAPVSDIRNQQHIRQAVATCAANLAGFVNRWKDAMPYMNVLEFIRQKIMWDSGTFEPNTSAPISLEEAELHLEQLRKNYLHRAVLGMIEDMMYGGSIHQDLINDDLKQIL